MIIISPVYPGFTPPYIWLLYKLTLYINTNRIYAMFTHMDNNIIGYSNSEVRVFKSKTL